MRRITTMVDGLRKALFEWLGIYMGIYVSMNGKDWNLSSKMNEGGVSLNNRIE